MVLSERLRIYPKESTTCKLCHIDAVTVKSHLLVLVVEDITRSTLVGRDLKMVTFLHYQYKWMLQRLHFPPKLTLGYLVE